MPCGNGTIDPGEDCDPPNGISCDPTCKTIVCGNGKVQPGEECDDGNLVPGDGCGSDCQLEDKLCIPGRSLAIARAAKRAAFVSRDNWTGENPDGNEEIFFFDKRLFDAEVDKLIRQGITQSAAESQLLQDRSGDFFEQLTDTLAPVVNDLPTINGNGRIVAFVSTGDLLQTGENLDGNLEVFRLDRKKLAKSDPLAFRQITSSVGVVNSNPTLRATQGRLLVFDSTADLVPDRCVGSRKDLATCSTNSDCANRSGSDKGVCGNPEQNRELFVWLARAARRGRVALRQITAAPSGESTAGRSVNFNTRATSFSSTANFFDTNPEGNREIYRITRKFKTLTPITQIGAAAGESLEPSQSKRRRIAFVTSADLDPTADNSDGNHEIVVWTSTTPPAFEQFHSTTSCENGAPSINSRGRFVVYHSTCDLIPSAGNADQSIFVWDLAKSSFLPLVIRGPNATASGIPHATRNVRVIAFEGNVATADPAVCFFNTKEALFEVLP